MLSTLPPLNTARRLVRASQEHPARWVAPTAIITILSFAYAQFGYRPDRQVSPTWAAQRDQAEPRGGKSPDPTTGDSLVRLTQAVDLASGQLDAARAQLAVLESSAGEDLDLLRAHPDSPGAENHLQRALAEMEDTLRQAENARQSNRELVSWLETALAEPGQTTAGSPPAIESQPALRQLRDELIAARSNTSRLQETRLPAHPGVQASLAIEAEIDARWQRELGTFLDGVRAEQPRLDSRVDTLTRQATELRERWQKLSFISANYNQRLADVQQWADRLTRAKSDLSAARDARIDALPVTPSPRIERSATSAHDARPVRALIVAGGLFGGWMVGMCVLWLTSGGNSAVDSRPVDTPPAATVAEEPAVAPAWQPPSPPIAVETTRAGRPAGRMTLRDALVRCAEQSGRR
jgi:hypothetical protein